MYFFILLSKGVFLYYIVFFLFFFIIYGFISFLFIEKLKVIDFFKVFNCMLLMYVLYVYIILDNNFV